MDGGKEELMLTLAAGSSHLYHVDSFNSRKLKEVHGRVMEDTNQRKSISRSDQWPSDWSVSVGFCLLDKQALQLENNPIGGRLNIRT
ncbi:hypothetical protein NQZ68_039159, partial [Dissostichus eleginoides]